MLLQYLQVNFLDKAEFYKIFLVIDLFAREKTREWERARKQGERQGERENPQADSPLSKEPDAGLDPRTLRSWPELKADA